MAVNTNEDQAFLNRLTEIVETNVNNNQFGVSELAIKMGISRSHLYRRVKTQTNHSISHFIRIVRLEKAMKLLQQKEGSAAQIAYQVGFGSPAYFNQCFHKHYGFPPGEVKKRFSPNETHENKITEENKTESANAELDKFVRKHLIRNKVYLGTLSAVVLMILTWSIYTRFSDESFFPGSLPKKNTELSIIVLPFKNLSNNPNNQYIADGITEDILNNLYWISSLRLVSRTSGEQFRETTLSAREIARKAGVKYVIEGSVRMYDKKIRVSAQLIDAQHHEDHLWSSNFDRSFEDIMGIQNEIALQVASKVNATLSENEIRQIKKIPTQNPIAYNYYLQARYLHNQAKSDQRSGFSKNAVENCIGYYENAIAEDEYFAEAYAGLANAWFTLTAWGWYPALDGFSKAKSLSLKALEISTDCAEAHAILGSILIWGESRFEEGGKALETSIGLNPNFATSRQYYAQYLMITGPIEQARIQIDRTLELEPRFWVVQNVNAWIYYFEGKHKNAIKACMLANELKPDYVANEWLFFLNYVKLGKEKKAMQMLQSIASRDKELNQHEIEISNAHKDSGIYGLFAWLIDINQNRPVPVFGLSGEPFHIAWWNVIIGNSEASIYWLQRCLQPQSRKSSYFNLIATNPDFKILHDDPRFIKILDASGLTPYCNQESK